MTQCSLSSVMIKCQDLQQQGRVIGLTTRRVAIKRLILRWVTVCEQINHLGMSPTPKSTQPSSLWGR